MSIPTTHNGSHKQPRGYGRSSGNTVISEGNDGRRLRADIVELPQAKTIKTNVSFVIPVKDERDTIVELYDRIAAVLADTTSFEVIFIDDGSSDGSWDVIRLLSMRQPGRVRGLRFRRNAGKAAALTAGFRAARGSVVFTLDADLQDDPKEIQRFLTKLDEGYDLVSGWKRVRHDPWHKVFPSRIFNWLLSHVTGVYLHDHNCGFKCYRAEVVKSLTLHGELHRMVPALAAIEGFRSTEIVVEHHARKFGVSKYGFERYLRGFVDMLVVGFFRKYRERPGHLIGGVSICSMATGLMLLACSLVLTLAQLSSLAVVSAVSGVMFLCTGILGSFFSLLSEMTIRGGLGSYWGLPIVDDTAKSQSMANGSVESVPPVPLSYHARRSTDQPTTSPTNS
jgi:dolichol-phosphate mannosyltransferase